MNEHDIYMQRCLELAKQGLGSTRSNPMVGCVVVVDNKIISEGYHRYFGGPHAEVEALKSLETAQLERAIVYVNLEPCSHHGKTPPCADLLISKGVKHLVIASTDPNPLVAGKGIAKLKAAGIQVEEGSCHTQNVELNKRFFTYHQKHRPFVILKWAQSTDGYLAPVDEGNYKLTGNLANILVHEWRSEEMGILVGRKTVEKDNPLLTVRHVPGINPVRIIFDPQCKLNSEHDVFNADSQTMVFNTRKSGENKNIIHVKIDEQEFLKNAMDVLRLEKINSVLVEGGTETLRQFIEAELWDEARIFTSPKKIGNGILAPVIQGKEKSVEFIGQDQLTVLVPFK